MIWQTLLSGEESMANDLLRLPKKNSLLNFEETNPAATLADLGPKRRGRYINIVDETARRKEEVQLQLDQAVAEGASEGRIRQLTQQLDMVEDTLLKELKSEGYHVIGRMDAAGDIRSRPRCSGKCVW
jgi:hypothetical protein